MIVVFAYLCTLTLWYYCLVLPPAYYLLPLFLQQYIMNTRYCFRSKVVIHEDEITFSIQKRGYEFRDTKVPHWKVFFSQFFREIDFTKKKSHILENVVRFFIVLSLCMVMAKA